MEQEGMMNKNAVIGNTKTVLKSVVSAMVVKEPNQPPLCRTIYKDQDDELWCICDSTYRKVRRISGSNLKRGYRSNVMYEIYD